MGTANTRELMSGIALAKSQNKEVSYVYTYDAPFSELDFEGTLDEIRPYLKFVQLALNVKLEGELKQDLREFTIILDERVIYRIVQSNDNVFRLEYHGEVKIFQGFFNAVNYILSKSGFVLIGELLEQIANVADVEKIKCKLSNAIGIRIGDMYISFDNFSNSLRFRIA